MSAATYSDYSRERAGFLWGLTLGQLTCVALTSLPGVAFLSVQAWGALGVWFLVWVVGVVLITVPAFGRSSLQWLVALVSFEVGRAMGWTRWQSKVAAGRAGPPGEADLPGVLSGIRTHDGPPFGTSLRRVAVIQDLSRRTWAATAVITHPGIGLAEGATRDRFGQGLAGLLEVAARGEVVSHIAVTVRSIPDDGAERAAWVARKRDPRAPRVATAINTALDTALGPATVRTEAFITVVAQDGALSRTAKEAGGGVTGRAHALYTCLREVAAQLQGPMGCTDVRWLTSPELAVAIRTGFAPGDRAALVDSELAARQNPTVVAGVPMGAAGPSTAESEQRCYHHDGWTSISDTVLLPAQGAVMGALAPVTTPAAVGERRSLTVFYPVVDPARAGRLARRRQYGSSMGTGLRTKMQMGATADDQQQAARSAGFDRKLVSGRAMIQPSAVATVTVPSHWGAAESGRQLDASIRGAGFVPQRLDLAQDAGFVAGAIPLGVGVVQHRSLR